MEKTVKIIKKKQQTVDYTALVKNFIMLFDS